MCRGTSGCAGRRRGKGLGRFVSEQALVAGNEAPAVRRHRDQHARCAVNLLGATERGDVVRYSWNPKEIWQAENINGAAVRR